MLYSEKYNFIFIHIPKTGGTSLFHTLKPYATCLPDGTSIEACNQPPLGHIRASDLRSQIGLETWNKCTKFAVIRNPWDWYTSLFMFNSGHPLDPDDPKIICSYRQQIKQRHWAVHQTEFICDETGQVIVDKLLKFENLNQETRTLCKELGIKIDLPHKNPTVRKFYTDFYDSETIDYFLKFYGHDVEKLGYKFSPELDYRWSFFVSHDLPKLTMKLAVKSRVKGIFNHLKSKFRRQ